MGDVMLLGVLGMPRPDDPKELSHIDWLQLKGRIAEARERIIADEGEITRLRAEVDRLTKARAECERQYQAQVAETAALLDRAQLAEKSRDEAVAELNKALETLGQLRVECNELETALGKASNLATSANQRLFDKEKEVSSLTETLWQLRRALSNTVLLRDSWRETCGSVIADTASELGCDADNEEILFAITRLKTRAQSAEASLAKLREAASELVKDAEPIKAVDCAWQGEIDEYRVDVKKFDALRSLLDEPDKDQNNAKR